MYLSITQCFSRTFGIGLLAVSMLWGFNAFQAHAESLRVMSFNIRYGKAKDGENHWEKRKELVVDTIKAFDPDIFGTQETLDFQRNYLDKHLSAWASSGVGRDDGKLQGEMTSIHFKKDRFQLLDQGQFWLSETPQVPGSKSWDSSLSRICSWVKLHDRQSESKRPLLIMNTHFDHRGVQARIESARLIRQKAKALQDGCDVLLTGDFNAAVNSEPYLIMFQQDHGEPYFQDTYAFANPNSDPAVEGTFTGFKAPATTGKRIDWIAAWGNFRILSAAIDRTMKDGRTPSDHYPVTAIVEQTPKKNSE
ncbi:Metal-dependent hydrolase [Planctomycetales bacterium 10988]|nr:Metal-dependent hydrolase [Planctomycetales bacterium 10988]